MKHALYLIAAFAALLALAGGAFARQDAVVEVPSPPSTDAAFLADLDKALREGCGSFYKYTGWGQMFPPSLVCVDGVSAEGGTLSLVTGGT